MNQIVQYIYSHPKETKRLIGITHEQLVKLIDNAKKVEEQKKEAIATTEKRLIKAGGGRKKLLSIEEEIILTLFYLHHLPTFQVLGLNFGVCESTANNIFHYWIDIIREILPSSLLEQVKKNKSDEQWVKEILTELELLVDSTEQDIQRPSNYEEQKKYYSGKQKNHTLKNQIISTPNGKEIVDVMVGIPGPTSDINLWREPEKRLDEKQRYRGDKAYQGNPRINTPKKKPRKKEMPPEIKEENKKKAKERIFVEHVIRLLKIFRVATERFRLENKNYEKVILTVCGLVRLRIGTLILS